MNDYEKTIAKAIAKTLKLETLNRSYEPNSQHKESILQLSKQ
jgi:hypothetical protein